MRRLLWWGIPAVIVVALGTAAVLRRDRALAYDTVRVEQRDLARVVSVTGRVEAADDVALAFEVGGRVTRVTAKVGDVVASGALLATLDATDASAARAEADAALRQARADLAALKAGMRVEEVRVAEIDVENARRAYAESTAAAAAVNAKATVEIANAYGDVPDTLRDAFTKADDAVRKQVDDLFTNDTAESPQLAYDTGDAQAEIDAETQRRALELELVAWSTDITTLAGDPTSRDAALVRAARWLDVALRFLERVSATLNATTNLSPTTSASYKTNVNTARANVNTARSAVAALVQTIVAQDATNRSAIATAQQDVTTKRNALATAEAKLALARSPATPEAIVAQDARVAQAAAALAAAEARMAKLALRAPFAGTVTVADARVGMIATAGSPVVSMISSAGFIVEANVPEVNLPGLAPEMRVRITLDAYGSTPVFAATIRTIDPAATIVDGVPTYRTTFAFAERDDRVRVGLTANVDIVAAEAAGVLVIPQRAVSTRNGDTFARVLHDRQAVEVAIRTGLQGSDGYVEVREGLVVGDVVIRSMREQR